MCIVVQLKWFNSSEKCLVVSCGKSCSMDENPLQRYVGIWTMEKYLQGRLPERLPFSPTIIHEGKRDPDNYWFKKQKSTGKFNSPLESRLKEKNKRKSKTCLLVNSYWHFEGSQNLHLQGQTCQMSSPSLTASPWRWKSFDFSKCNHLEGLNLQ